MRASDLGTKREDSEIFDVGLIEDEGLALEGAGVRAVGIAAAEDDLRVGTSKALIPLGF